MRALRNVLAAVTAAFILTLVIAASAAAVPRPFVPSALQTTSYVWPQPPAWVGVVPTVAWVPVSTAYVWPQPPSWVPITG